MSKNKKKKKTQQTRGAAVRQFCVVVFALLCALAICGGTLSIRFYGNDWETGGTLAPLLTLHPSDSDGTLDTVPPAQTDAPDTETGTVTIAPETDPPRPPETTPAVTEPPQTEPSVTTPAVIRPPETTPAVTEPPQTEPPVTVPPETQSPVTPPVGNDDPEALTNRPLPDLPEPEHPIVIDVRVPESEAVDDTYFSDAVFIGDSRTVGLSLYSGLKSNYYSQQGLNVSSVMKNAFIPSGDQKLTLSQALDANPGFTKVYISFGINEIGWNTTSSFVETYTTLVELVMEKLPDAVIYIQEILPMYKATAENDRYRPMGGNGKVAEYNEELYELCWEKGLHYIALTEVFADENGDLNVSDSGDGIHLGVASSRAWIDYLKTHTVR